jgi:degradative hydroxymethylglutaryl-CoA reductase
VPSLKFALSFVWLQFHADSSLTKMWTGFWKKSLKERQKQISLIYPNEKFTESLDDDVADKMIENCIGTIQIPLGLGLNFIINGKQCSIPMATEEPSVIAAVSGAAKTIASAGGFYCEHSENVVQSQIQFLNVNDDEIDSLIDKIDARRMEIVVLANTFCPSMVKRGGGVFDVYSRKVVKSNKKSTSSYHLVVHLKIKVCDSMGANIGTSCAEGVADFLQNITGKKAGLKIFSNYTIDRLATASFRIPISLLAYKGFTGEFVAQSIIESNEFANDDHFRAATHNKGIMNGIDAVALATGQDFRAIEASSHTWASCSHTDEKYRSLTEYYYKEENNVQFLVGKLTLPLSVGIKGGAITNNPAYLRNLSMMGVSTSGDLSDVLINLNLDNDCSWIVSKFCGIEGVGDRGHSTWPYGTSCQEYCTWGWISRLCRRRVCLVYDSNQQN